MTRHARGERGAALLMTFMMMMVLAGLATAVGVFSHNAVLTGKVSLLDRQAWYVAEAGWQRARQAIAAGTWTPTLCTGAPACTETFGAGEYVVTITNSDNEYTITAGGYVPNRTTYQSRRQIVESEVDVSSTGTNLSLAAAAAASTNSSGSCSSSSHKAACIKDGDSGTYWEATTNGSNQWVSLDFGSATTVSRMVLTEKDARINAMTVEYSSDGSSWTTAPNLNVVEDPNKTWEIAFVATSARYFRAYFTDVDSSKKANVKELESYAASTMDQGTYATSW